MWDVWIRVPLRWTRVILSMTPVRGLNPPSIPLPFHWRVETCSQTYLVIVPRMSPTLVWQWDNMPQKAKGNGGSSTEKPRVAPLTDTTRPRKIVPHPSLTVSVRRDKKQQTISLTLRSILCCPCQDLPHQCGLSACFRWWLGNSASASNTPNRQIRATLVFDMRCVLCQNCTKWSWSLSNRYRHGETRE
jgi:hypothetical protein